MPFSLSFSLFSCLCFSSPCFFSLFVVLRVLLPSSFLSCRVVVSFFRLFLALPSSLVLSLPCFRWWWILFFCYFVSVIHPPCAACEPEVRVFPLRSVFFLAFLLFICIFFLSSFPFFDSDVGHRLCHPVFIVVYPSNRHVIIICDVGWGSIGVVRELWHRPLLLVCYRTARIRELPPPADWPGHYHTQSLETETPHGSKSLTTPNSEVASIQRCPAPYSALAWLPLPYLPSLC